MEKNFLFVCATNKVNILKDYLLTSNCLNNYNFLIIGNITHITKEYNRILDMYNAEYHSIIFIHHDVIMYEDFQVDFEKAIDYLDENDPDWAIAGAAGIGDQENSYGYMSNGWGQRFDTPCRTRVLDELILVIRNKNLRFDENLVTQHLFGTDICLQAEEQNKNVYVICSSLEHHSTGKCYLDDPTYNAPHTYIDKKWNHRKPIATTCGRFD